MATVSEELDSFYQFAEGRLRSDATGETLDSLYAEWRICHPSPDELDTNVRAVRAALRDLDAGEIGRPIAEFIAEFRQRNGI